MNPFALAFYLAAAYGAAALGSYFTNQGLGSWYRGLDKPSWTPSGRTIGAVWSVLYGLMGVAAYRTRGSGPPQLLFWLQLGLNVAWSGLFFALRSPGAALVEIVVLWGAVAAWLRASARRSGVSALLIAPYLAWVTFAAGLNAAIWRRNR